MRLFEDVTWPANFDGSKRSGGDRRWIAGVICKQDLELSSSALAFLDPGATTMELGEPCHQR
jgi:hypothetical protein